MRVASSGNGSPMSPRKRRIKSAVKFKISSVRNAEKIRFRHPILIVTNLYRILRGNHERKVCTLGLRKHVNFTEYYYFPTLIVQK
jgi:hypothetical protein